MSHPTADWIYQHARKKMPHISLGTVYRNLNTLTGEGLLQEITNTKGLSRYQAEAVLSPAQKLERFRIGLKLLAGSCVSE